MKGRIYLYSYSPADYPLPRDSATVSIDGTNISTMADSAGRWELNNLPAGIYNITFSRPGFAPYREIGYQFVGGGTAYFADKPALYKQITNTVSELKAEFRETTIYGPSLVAVRITGMLNGPATSYKLPIMILTGEDETMSINDSRGAVSELMTANPGDSFEYWIHPLRFEGRTPGSTIYVRAYAFMNASKYYDPEVDADVFNNYTQPATTSFVVP